MVNWKQRELERARNVAMVREQHLRDLRGKGEVERGTHDERHEHDHETVHSGKRS